jgi:DNA-binding XRE family transcriptional regulator
VLYYKDRRWNEPVKEWLNSRSISSISAGILARITDLSLRGLNLSDDRLKPISARGKKERRVRDFYELRDVSKGWRIAVYHDHNLNCFILLFGFRKSLSQQTRNTNKAYALVYDYLERKERGMSNSALDDISSRLKDKEFAGKYGEEMAKLSFSNTLLDARNKKKLTQVELARKLGKSQPYIAKLESGEANPTLSMVGKILSVLGYRLDTGVAPLAPKRVDSRG